VGRAAAAGATGRRRAPAGAAPPADADTDGIADAWEAAHGLDPSNAADATMDPDSDGYTNIEEYVNELADTLIPS